MHIFFLYLRNLFVNPSIKNPLIHQSLINNNFKVKKWHKMLDKANNAVLDKTQESGNDPFGSSPNVVKISAKSSIRMASRKFLITKKRQILDKMSRKTSKTINDISNSCGELSRSVSKLYANVPAVTTAASSGKKCSESIDSEPLTLADAKTSHSKKKKEPVTNGSLNSVSTSTFSRVITFNGGGGDKKKKIRSELRRSNDDDDVNETTDEVVVQDEHYMNETFFDSKSRAESVLAVKHQQTTVVHHHHLHHNQKKKILTAATDSDANAASVAEAPPPPPPPNQTNRRNKKTVVSNSGVLDPDHFYNEISENSSDNRNILKRTNRMGAAGVGLSLVSAAASPLATPG